MSREGGHSTQEWERGAWTEDSPEETAAQEGRRVVACLGGACGAGRPWVQIPAPHSSISKWLSPRKPHYPHLEQDY